MPNNLARSDQAQDEPALSDGALSDGALSDGALSDGTLSDGAPQVQVHAEHRVKVDKYEFVKRGPRAAWLEVYYDGKLISVFDRDPAVALMMEQLDAARMVVQAAREIVDVPTLLRKKFLQEALALHDRLTSDREPPSARCTAERALCIEVQHGT